MKQSVIVSAVLWVLALGTAAYLFRGNENLAMAVIILAILGFVDVVVTMNLFNRGQ